MAIPRSSFSLRHLLILLLALSSVLVLSYAQDAPSSECRAHNVNCPDDGKCEGSCTTIPGGQSCSYKCTTTVSTGTIVGILFGVVAVVAIIVTLTMFFMRCGCFAYRRGQINTAQMPPLMYAQQAQPEFGAPQGQQSYQAM